MFSSRLTRIFLLAWEVIASWMLFYFDGFAPDWPWHDSQLEL